MFMHTLDSSVEVIDNSKFFINLSNDSEKWEGTYAPSEHDNQGETFSIISINGTSKATKSVSPHPDPNNEDTEQTENTCHVIDDTVGADTSKSFISFKKYSFTDKELAVLNMKLMRQGYCVLPKTQVGTKTEGGKRKYRALQK